MWRQELRTEGRSCMEPTGRNLQRKITTKYGVQENEAHNMTALHKQLQHEAENIIRWKASTEVNAKQLARQLDEAQVTITDQRRNLMELQMNSENLSQSLLIEREEKQIIENKVKYTRQLFLKLEQEKTELSTTLTLSEQDKKVICDAQENTLKRVAELTDSFQYLNDLHKQKVDNISAQATSEVNKLQDKTVLQEQQIEEMNASLSQHLQDQIVYKERLTKSEGLLKLTEDRLSCAQESNVGLTSLVTELQISLENTKNEKEGQLQTLTEQLSRLEEDFQQEQCRHVKSQAEFAEAVEKIKLLKNLNDSLEGSKSEIMDKLDAVMIRKKEVEEDLAQRNDTIRMLQAEKAELTEKITVSCETLTDIRSKYLQLELDFQSVQNAEQMLESQLNKSNQHLYEEQQKVCDLTEKISELTQELELRNKMVEEMKVDLQSTKEQNNEMLNSVENLNITVQEAENYQVETEKKVTSLEDSIQSLTNEITNLRSEKDTLKEQWKEQQTIIKSKEEQIKKHEKEVKSKTKALTQETKKMEKVESSNGTLKKKLQNMEEAYVFIQAQLQGTLAEKEQTWDMQEKKEKDLKESLQIKEKEIIELQTLTRSQENDLQETRHKLSAVQEEKELNVKELNNHHEKLQMKVKENEELSSAIDKIRQELKENEEQLTTSVSIREQLQYDITDLKRCLGDQRNKYTAENRALREAVEVAKQAQKQSKEQVAQINKEKEEIMLGNDAKVKDMLGIFERYRSENEIKLKKMTKKLLEAQQKLAKKEEDIANVSSANTKLLAEAVVRTKTPVNKKQERIYEPTRDDDELTTPSPRQFLSSYKVTPKTPFVRPESEQQPAQEGHSRPSILKRILVPVSEQKHVRFRAPVSLQRKHEDDSSSDAAAYELDDSFDEMVKSKKRKSSTRKLDVKPLDTGRKCLSLNQLKDKDQQDKGSQKAHRMIKPETPRLRTYSGINPKVKKVQGTPRATGADKAELVD